MRFPQEIVVETVIPTLRALLVKAMATRGLTQTDIATRLGVSQSAVSKYLQGRLAVDPRIAADERVTATVERVADGLAKDTLSPVEALGALLALVRDLENRGPVCAIHEEQMPSLAGLGCDLCVRGAASTLVTEQAALGDVRAAVRILAASPHLPAFVPHVGSNIVVALPDARDASQVAAVPGNLFVLKGRIAAPADPEFGVSRHVAHVLLTVLRADATKRACLNLAPHERFIKAARSAGAVVQEIPPDVERDPSALAATDVNGADVLVHGGAFGIEPQAYLLGASATAVAEEAARLARDAASAGPA